METLSTAAALGFLRRQIAEWPMAAANFEALRRVETRTMECRGRRFAVQHNPARIASTGAKVADGKATKLIVPSELQNLGGVVPAIKELVTEPRKEE